MKGRKDDFEDRAKDAMAGSIAIAPRAQRAQVWGQGHLLLGSKAWRLPRAKTNVGEGRPVPVSGTFGQKASLSVVGMENNLYRSFTYFI